MCDANPARYMCILIYMLPFSLALEQKMQRQELKNKLLPSFVHFPRVKPQSALKYGINWNPLINLIMNSGMRSE